MIEKRQHPRVTADVPLRLGPLTSAVVRDISLSGVRCVTSTPLVPMTVVSLRIELPTGQDGTEAWQEVPCEGVVVRSRVFEEDGQSRYESAILFKDLPEPMRQTLSVFVESRLRARLG